MVVLAAGDLWKMISPQSMAAHGSFTLEELECLFVVLMDLLSHS